ncbi:MAG: cytochrome c maturation protein CcmE [Deferribacterota bacterium]|nr:cytochrome c maturation protein CcmE [Deferribacterota bacterium]
MKKKYIISSCLIIIAIIYLITTGFNKSGIYYLEVDELIAKDISLGTDVRVSGLVKVNSVIRNDKEKELFFKLIGEDNNYINVSYNGIIPDTFKEGRGVIVEGVYNKEKNTLDAKTLLAKCPSKYEAKLSEK